MLRAGLGLPHCAQSSFVLRWPPRSHQLCHSSPLSAANRAQRIRSRPPDADEELGAIVSGHPMAQLVDRVDRATAVAGCIPRLDWMGQLPSGSYRSSCPSTVGTPQGGQPRLHTPPPCRTAPATCGAHWRNTMARRPASGPRLDRTYPRLTPPRAGGPCWSRTRFSAQAPAPS